MKVKELIKKLAVQDPEAEALLSWDLGYGKVRSVRSMELYRNPDYSEWEGEFTEHKQGRRKVMPSVVVN